MALVLSLKLLTTRQTLVSLLDLHFGSAVCATLRWLVWAMVGLVCPTLLTFARGVDTIRNTMEANLQDRLQYERDRFPQLHARI